MSTQNKKEKRIETKGKRAHIIVLLIVVLMLICLIPTMIPIGKRLSSPTETAEINRELDTNEEKISADTTTVQAGETYTAPRDGIYKIELHGGKSTDLVTNKGNISGLKGDKFSGYVRLNSGDVISATTSFSEKSRADGPREAYGLGKAGYPVTLSYGDEIMAYVAGGSGLSFFGDVRYFCKSCGYMNVGTDSIRSYPGEDKYFWLSHEDWTNSIWRENVDQFDRDPPFYAGSTTVYSDYDIQYAADSGFSCKMCRGHVVELRRTVVTGSWSGSKVVSIGQRPKKLADDSFVNEGLFLDGCAIEEGASDSETQEAYLCVSVADCELRINPNGGLWNGSAEQHLEGLLPNTTINVPAPVRTGYTFTGWDIEGEGSSIDGNTFTMGTKNTTLTARWSLNTYTISYDLAGGEVGGNPENYTIETETFALENPTRVGYTFKGWTGSNGTTPETTVTIEKGSTENKSYTANWEANEVEYHVKHWTQKLDGIAQIKTEEHYTLALDEKKVGKTDDTVTPDTKEYVGFTAPIEEIKEVTILGDGSLEVNYYYTRNIYHVTLNKGKGMIIVLGEQDYLYEEEVTINGVVAPGYKWIGWEGYEESEEIKHTFTMPANDVEFTSVTEANTNTAYTVKHWLQKLEGKADQHNEDNYELVATDDCTGTTDEQITPGTRKYTGFKAPYVQDISMTITGGGTTVVDYYYTRNYYEVVINKGKGIDHITVTGNITGEGKDKYLYEEEVTIEGAVESGYTWLGWTEGGIPEENDTIIPELTEQQHRFTIGTEKVEYTANATPNSGIPYVVKHWQQKLQTEITEEGQNPDNYTLIDTEELTGTAGEKIRPEVKEYAGFTAPEVEEVEILGTGDLVVNYYYIRNTNTPYIVKHWKENLPTENNETDENVNPDEIDEDSLMLKSLKKNYTLVDTDHLTGITGAKIRPEVKEYAGFTAPEVEEVEILGNGQLVVDYYYTRNTDTKYKVRHWRQNLDGIAQIKDSENYTLIDTEELTGITGAKVRPEVKEYAGFTAPEAEEVEILGEGGLVVNYYYTRNSYTLTLIKGIGIQDLEVIGNKIEGGKDKYLYEEEITIKATVAPGYTWSGWTGTNSNTSINYQFVMPAEEVKYTANATPNTDTKYKVRHWRQNLEGIAQLKDSENYTLIDTEELTGITGAKVRPEVKEYAGFTAPEAEEVEILGDGGLIVDYYYTRNKYKVTLNPDKGMIIVLGAGEYLYEQEVTINGILNKGYEWVGWRVEPSLDEIPEENGITSPEIEEMLYTFQMPAEDLEYTPVTILSSNVDTKYQVEHWRQKLNGKAHLHNSENYTLIETEDFSGGTEVEVTPETKIYIGFNTPGVQDISVTVTPEGATVVRYYYTRRTDLTCLVTYLDKATGKTILRRTIENLTFEEEIAAKEEIMELEDYSYEGLEPELLKVGIGENKINIYYVKKEGKVIAHHYIYDEKEDKYTTTKLVEDDEIIGKIGKDYRTEASSKIPENYIVVDETPENYTGIIEEGTKEITYYYKLKTPKIDTEVGGEITEGGSQREDGKWEIKAGEEIKYKISYKTKIEEYKGKVKIEVKAELPEGTKIEEGRCDFAGGTYDEETNTITWTKEIEEINTFKNGTYTDGIEKDITIIYAEDYVVDEIEPKVTGKTILYYPNGNPGGEDKPLIEDETDGTGKVIIHHYIYDEKTDTYTEAKLVEDEEIVKKVGEEYISKKSKEIPENYTCINERPEGHKGTVTKDPIEVNYYYKLKNPTIDTSTGGEWAEGGNQREDGKWEIKAGEEIKYKIKYKTEIEDYKGKAKIEIKAELPEGTRIDEENCDFAGGKYDAETNTITWTKEIEGIDTFENGNYIEEITKDITIVYAEDYVLDEITPKVTGKTTLYYPDDYPIGGEGDGTLTEDETDGKGKIIIYHYIYDEKTDTYTTQKLVENEQIKGEIGKEYLSKPSDKIPANYIVVDEQPEGYKGKYTKETIKIKYYYKLKTPKTENEIDSTVTEGGTQSEEGKWEIKAGEEIKYKVSYKTKIEDYKGKARIEITAKLPEGTGIEEGKCNLAGGTYNKETNTITWTKEVEEIDTFAHKENTNPDDVGAPSGRPGEEGTYIDGRYILEITKEITIVYDNDYILDDIGLKVKGNTILYYPEDYPIEGDGTLTEDETEKMEKGKIIVHHYIYDREDNKYTETKVAPDEEIEKEIGENYETKPSEKVPLNYECINEKPEGHTGTIEKGTKEISYYYKLKATKTEGNGESNILTELEKDEEGNWVIKAGEEIEYEIKYEAKIEDYIGKATIEIKAELPEGTKIDEGKCDLAGGIYNKETNTIIWTKEIENIDTFAHKENTNPDNVGAPSGRPGEEGTYIDGKYILEITKNIKIVYAENYTLKDANLKITGNITTYYPDNYPEKGGETLPKEDDPNNPEEKMGKVIVKYLDKDTDEEIIKIQNINLDKVEGYSYEITGKIGEAYETEEKEIPYYMLVRKAENSKGEIKEEEQIVTYYYKKLNFNIGIEKTIDTITLNGKNIKVSNKETAKLEIKKEELKKIDLLVKYNIKVTNKGEIGGASEILEQIPEGFQIAYLPEYWRINKQENLETDVNLEAGESKELEIVLRWENKEDNLGAKTNLAKIKDTTNLANFEDTNEEDNKSVATVIVSIKTGEVVSTIIIVMIIGALVICSYITISTMRRKDPELKGIKFLK